VHTTPITVIFDGVCNLCDVVVRYLHRFDTKRQFHYISFQSDEGAALLPRHGIVGPPDTVYVITHSGELLIEDSAIIYLFSRLGGIHNLFALFIRLIPPPLRRSMYKWVSRNRYRVFGMKADSVIP
jgi:predicted DCC family thiol-disulfide oxidoreductase YuxK